MVEVVIKRWLEQFRNTQDNSKWLALGVECHIKLVRGSRRTILIRCNFFHRVVDTNVTPVLTNKFNQFERATLCRDLHVQNKRITVWQFTHSVTIDVFHADFIQKGICHVRIELSKGLLGFFTYETGCRRKRDILLRTTKTEENDFVDFVTVHRNRHRLTEPQITEHFTFLQIFGRHVERKCTHVDLRFQINSEVALFLIFQKQRCIVEVQRLSLIVNFRVDQFQKTNFAFTHEQFILLVDVRQLLSSRINLEEIRVGNQMTAFCIFPDDDVAFQCWNRISGQTSYQIRLGQHWCRCVHPVRVAVIGFDCIIAVFKSKCLGICVGIRINIRMELTQEIHRLETLRIVVGKV